MGSEWFSPFFTHFFAFFRSSSFSSLSLLLQKDEGKQQQFTAKMGNVTPTPSAPTPCRTSRIFHKLHLVICHVLLKPEHVLIADTDIDFNHLVFQPEFRGHLEVWEPKLHHTFTHSSRCTFVDVECVEGGLALYTMCLLPLYPKIITQWIQKRFCGVILKLPHKEISSH